MTESTLKGTVPQLLPATCSILGVSRLLSRSVGELCDCDCAGLYVNDVLIQDINTFLLTFPAHTKETLRGATLLP